MKQISILALIIILSASLVLAAGQGDSGSQGNPDQGTGMENSELKPDFATS